MNVPYKNKIDSELVKFFSKKKEEAITVSPELLDAVCKLEDYSMRGGKRIRPSLVVLAYSGCGGKKIDEAIKVSITFELMQSFCLIHDDIMDNDTMRRGKPTIYKMYQDKYDVTLSYNLALDIGDFTACYAIEPIIKSKFDLDKKYLALVEMNDVIRYTCYGQFLDLMSSNSDITEDYLEKMHAYKTARYTLASPLRLGAMLAGADARTIKQLDEFGMNVGKAFQLKDDILGIFGDMRVLGKKLASDIVQGKKTLLVLKSKSEYINSKLGKQITPKELEKIKKIMIESGSLDYNEKLINKLLSDAKTILRKINLKDKEKSILLKIADFVGNRSN